MLAKLPKDDSGYGVVRSLIPTSESGNRSRCRSARGLRKALVPYQAKTANAASRARASSTAEASSPAVDADVAARLSAGPITARISSADDSVRVSPLTLAAGRKNESLARRGVAMPGMRSKRSGTAENGRRYGAMLQEIIGRSGGGIQWDICRG